MGEFSISRVTVYQSVTTQEGYWHEYKFKVLQIQNMNCSWRWKHEDHGIQIWRCVGFGVKICSTDFGVIDFLSPKKKWLLYLDLSNQGVENTSPPTDLLDGQLTMGMHILSYFFFFQNGTHLIRSKLFWILMWHTNDMIIIESIVYTQEFGPNLWLITE